MAKRKFIIFGIIICFLVIVLSLIFLYVILVEKGDDGIYFKVGYNETYFKNYSETNISDLETAENAQTSGTEESGKDEIEETAETTDDGEIEDTETTEETDNGEETSEDTEEPQGAVDDEETTEPEIVLGKCGDGVCEKTSETNEDTENCPRDCESKEEYSILLDGRFAVIIPKGYEELGEAHLKDIKNCHKLISNFLGRDMPWNTTFLKTYISTDGKNRGYSNRKGLFYKRTKENIDMDLEDVKENNPDGFLYKSGPDYCANTHEFTHVFMGDMIIPGWINEGFAEYAQKNIQSGSKDNTECRDNGWYGRDFWVDDKEKLFPYSDLDKEWNHSEPGCGSKWYATSMCLVEHIDETYGRQKMQELLSHYNPVNRSIFLLNLSARQSYFIDEVMVPVLGADIKTTLKEKFGLD